MSASIISFYAIGIVGLVSALVVASSLNPIHRIAFQIQVFLSGSFLMIILDFYFLGLTYIIVYVGAIMILFLFVIMMVQIHLMPVSTSITPRIQDAKSSVAALDDSTDRPSDLALIEGHGIITQGTLSLSADTPLGGVRRSSNGVQTRFLSFQIIQVPLLSQFVFTLINPSFQSKFINTNTGYGGGDMVVNYFFPSWFIEFKTMTDLETLANILYLGYPTAQLIVGIALWAVLIGIIKVTASKA